MPPTPPAESESSPQASAADRSGVNSQIHAGYSLEAGVLARARNWVDIFGWIRLGRVLRVAGSPLLFVLVAVTMSVWMVGVDVLVGGGFLRELSPFSSPSLATSPIKSLLMGAIAWVDGLRWLVLPNAMATQSSVKQFSLGLRSQLLVSGWSVLVWAPTAMLLLRQGALLTAGRPMQPLGDVTKWVTRRTSRAYFAAIVPAVGVLSVLWMVPIVGWVANLFGTWFLLPFAVVISLLAIPIGMLSLGAWVAVPISWAAIINERDPDPLDSLSRGYEYLYRRPLRLGGYLAVAVFILSVLNLITTLVVVAGSALVAGPLEAISGRHELAQLTARVLQWVPVVVVSAVSWSLVGGIYLLLRQDAGGQEVEDLWIEPASPPEPLPELPA